MVDEVKPGAAASLLAGYVSRTALARELGVSVDTLSRWEARGAGPPLTRVGRRVLYRRGAVEDWLRAQEGAGPGEEAAAS